MTALTEPLLVHASRNLPRYTSYPTALAFQPAPDDTLTRDWLGAIRPTDTVSIYVHIPFCERLCWYCGCHTSVPNGYDRISDFLGHLTSELDLWSDALPPHAGAAHVHFGGGSPNSLSGDHPLMREAMVMLLRRLRPGAEVVEVSHLGKFAAAVKAHGEPDLICLDLKLPDTLGVSGILEVRAAFPHTPLAVISSEPAAHSEDPCIEAGADIYIEKSAGATEISAALKTLLSAESELDQEEVDGTQTKLSKRQKQLILMLDQGLSNRDIAEKLGISEHTVKVHLWRLFKRIGVNSRTQMLHYARVNGLLIN